jgi:hypothetical protein
MPKSIEYVIILQTMVTVSAAGDRDTVSGGSRGKQSLLMGEQYTAVEDCVQFI